MSEDKFVADALALKHKHGMSDAEYAGALAGWFIAFCRAMGRDPAADFLTALDACSEEPGAQDLPWVPR